MITALLLLLSGGLTYNAYEEHNAVKSVKMDNAALHQQVNGNSQDIETLGTYVASKPWNAKSARSAGGDWRSSIAPNGSGGLEIQR